ncbi:unnamed protein product [Prorocentrum cordatum]|uniref:Uncharacterized protein n=1 Tax=Prorocentrum cordatum TaxID=2364126 RepID=A0ABN9RR87_9DINO|nr:unnamed protein product [Polarella glacialis]
MLRVPRGDGLGTPTRREESGGARGGGGGGGGGRRHPRAATGGLRARPRHTGATHPARESAQEAPTGGHHNDTATHRPNARCAHGTPAPGLQPGIRQSPHTSASCLGAQARGAGAATVSGVTALPKMCE